MNSEKMQARIIVAVDPNFHCWDLINIYNVFLQIFPVADFPCRSV